MTSVPSTTPAAAQRRAARMKSPSGLVVAALCGIVLAFYHGLWWPGLVLHNPYSLGALPFLGLSLEKALTDRYAWMGARAPYPYREPAVRLVLAGSLAALLAGVQLGPAATMLAGSDRSRSETTRHEALYWSPHPLRLATMVGAPLAAEADPVAVRRYF
jgi:hypothetical protein